MLFGICTTGITWLIKEISGVILEHDRLAYSLCLAIVLGVLFLSYFKRFQLFARVCIFLFLSGYFVSLTIVNFFVTVNTGNVYALASVIHWLPILYVVSFLFLPSRTAVAASVTIYLAVLAMVVIGLFDLSNQVSNQIKALLYNVSVAHLFYLFCMLGVVQLKTEQRKHKIKAEEMERAAHIDGLLGIPNRRFLEKHLNRLHQEKASMVILLIDVDHFKLINDTYGHWIGDDVLRGVVECLQHNLRPGDTIGRWGGEEFLIVAQDTHLDKAAALAERLRDAVAEETFGSVVHVTVSIGVSEFCWNEQWDNVFHSVDKALYRAKSSGRNKVVISDLV